MAGSQPQVRFTFWSSASPGLGIIRGLKNARPQYKSKSVTLKSMPPPAQQFLSVALPIIVTLVISIRLASISQIKRLDDIVRRLDPKGCGYVGAEPAVLFK